MKKRYYIFSTFLSVLLITITLISKFVFGGYSINLNTGNIMPSSPPGWETVILWGVLINTVAASTLLMNDLIHKRL